MAKGKALPASQGDTYTVNFQITGVTGALSVTTTTETDLVVGVGSTNTDFTVPWDCRVERVFVSAVFATSAESFAAFRIRRQTAQAGADNDIIRNAAAGAAVDYVRLDPVVGGLTQFVDYDGSLQDSSVAPSFSSVASAETAVGFLESEAEFNAGDVLTATYELTTGTTSMAHVICAVTLARQG